MERGCSGTGTGLRQRHGRLQERATPGTRFALGLGPCHPTQHPRARSGAPKGAAGPGEGRRQQRGCGGLGAGRGGVPAAAFSPHPSLPSFPAAPVPARGDWEGNRSRGNRGHRWPHFLQYKPGFLRFLLGPSPGGGARGGVWVPHPHHGGGEGRPGSAPGGAGWVGGPVPGAVSAPPSQEVKPLLCPSLGGGSAHFPKLRGAPQHPRSPPTSLGTALTCGRAWKKLVNPNQERGLITAPPPLPLSYSALPSGGIKPPGSDIFI